MFSLPDFRGQTNKIVPIDFQPRWYSLDAIVGFHVMSGVDHSNSTIFLWDPKARAYGAICGGLIENGLETKLELAYFFIQYNVPNSCLGKPPAGAPG